MTELPQEQPRSPGVPPSVRSAAAWSWRILIIGGLIGAALWVLAALKVIVVPIAIALLLTVLLMPVRRFLETRLKFRRGPAAASALLLLLLVVGGLIAVAGGSIAAGVRDLQDQAIQGFERFMLWLEEGSQWVNADQLSSYVESIQSAISTNQGEIVSGALGAASTAGHVAAGTLIALFCTFFFLHDGELIWGWLVRLFPRSARTRVHEAGRRGMVTLAAYTRTQILVAAVDAVGIGLGAAILQVPLAASLAILVFVGSFIPVVGAVVTGAIAVLVALFTKGWLVALIMLGVVLAVQQLEGHVLQPFLMGHAVSLHPVAVLLAVAAGSFTAGIVGALFAVPTVAVLNTAILYLNGHDKYPGLGTAGGSDPPISRSGPTS